MVIDPRAKIISLPETQTSLLLPYWSNWKTEKIQTRVIYWLGPGFKMGLNENLTKFREIQENIFFSDRYTYFVTYTQTI